MKLWVFTIWVALALARDLDQNTSVPCGLSTKQYCPPGHSHPLPTSLGYFVTGLVSPSSSALSDVAQGSAEEGGHSSQAICPRGSYCIEGKRYLCPAGRYGSSLANTNSSCSGVCTEGHYCPEGSSSSKQHPCGKDATVYCPRGSAAPLRVSRSHYTHGYESGTKALDIQKVVFQNMDAVSKYCLALSGKVRDYATCPANGARLSTVSTALEIAAYVESLQKNKVTVSTPTRTTDGTYSFTVTFSGGYNRYTDLLVAAKDTSAPLSATVLVTRLSMATEGLVGEDHLGLRHTSQSLCEAGYWCDETTGIRQKCPPGRYGAEQGLYSMECSGLCSEGHYCQEGSTSKTQLSCGHIELFCPLGSSAPQEVNEGYYTVNSDSSDAFDDARTRIAERKCEPGTWCQGGIRRLCAPGYWGESFGLTTYICSGPCSAGHLCPEGSTKPVEVVCGDPDFYCLPQSFKPIRVAIGSYSTGGIESTRTGQAIAPPGKYAVSGLLFTCRAGYYGASEGLSTPSCSGPCAPGFYCPTGSTSPVMRACGRDDLYCPASSVAPLKIFAGFYTADYLYNECPPGLYRNDSRLWVDVTLPGVSRLRTVATKPDCELCPAGKFKAVAGDNSTLCTSCPDEAVSTEDRMLCQCLQGVLSGFVMYFNATEATCNKLASELVPLLPDSHWGYNISLTRVEQKECEPGHYCIAGLRYKCPKGTYGALARETRPTCQGQCRQGYYCQEASISPFSTPCGANQICPNGSSLPIPIPPGYYSVNTGDRETVRYEMAMCPPGSYCPGDGVSYLCPPGSYADVGRQTLSTCAGVCTRGYFCTAGSSSPKQNMCGGAHVYCLPGSTAPTSVTDGFYSIFTGVDAGAQQLWDPLNRTASAELPCEPGYYCIKGVKYPCPPGTFGWQYGLTSPLCSGLCSAGYYCPSYLKPQTGAPLHTIWPGKPHTSAAVLECGGGTFFCPRGAIFPLKVGTGNFSVGGTDAMNNTRTGQKVCLPGTFCVEGIVSLCPQGHYGDKPGLAVATCSGWCPAGFKCPVGTAIPIACSGATYSVGSGWECIKCPQTVGVEVNQNLKCRNQRSCCFTTG